MPLKFQEIDEAQARYFFDMLKDAPSITDLEKLYPGIENAVHALTAQLATFFVLPHMEGELGSEDLIEALRRYMLTAFAFGLVMRDNDVATNYVMNLYNKEDSNPDNKGTDNTNN